MSLNLANNCTVIFALPNMTSGGAERVVCILANQFILRKIKVKILLYYGDAQHYDLHPDVDVYCMNLLSLPTFKRISAIHRKLKEIKKNERNTFFVPFLSSILNLSIAANVATGIPLVACERNNPYIKGKSFVKRIRAEIPFVIADHCVFQTPEARRYYSLVKETNCSVINNPITDSSFIWKKELSPQKLISICRLHKQKNLSMTLDVIEQLIPYFPKIHIDIYGDGPDKEAIYNEIYRKKLTEHVELKGVTQQVQQKLSEASVFISTSDYEGISNSMLEAMSVGMPIICTDCPIGGARLMLDKEAGILCPVGDSKYFAQCLYKLLTTPSYAEVLGRNAKTKAVSFSPERITAQWLHLFYNLL